MLNDSMRKKKKRKRHNIKRNIQVKRLLEAAQRFQKSLLLLVQRHRDSAGQVHLVEQLTSETPGHTHSHNSIIPPIGTIWCY